MRTGTGQHRRSIRLTGYDYSQPGAYFVTICAYERHLLFGEILNGTMWLSGCGKIAAECWRAIPEHFAHVELGEFVLMPNHLHAILVLHDRAALVAPPVGATHWVAPTRPRGPTESVAPTHRGEPTESVAPTRPRGPTRGSIGAIVGAYKMWVSRQMTIKGGHTGHVWQRNYFERIIRDQEEWNRIHLYIETNPSAWDRDEENPGAHGSGLEGTGGW